MADHTNAARRNLDSKSEQYRPLVEADGKFACPMKIRGCKFTARYIEGVDGHIAKCPLVLIDPFLTTLTNQNKELQKATSEASKTIRQMKQESSQFKDYQEHEIKMLKKALKHKDAQLAELKEALRMTETEIEVPLEKHYDLDSDEQKRQAIYFISRQSEKLYSILKEVLIKKADRNYCDIMISKLEDQMEMAAEKAARVATDRLANDLKQILDTKVSAQEFQAEKELLIQLKKRILSVEEKEMRLSTALVDPDSFLELQQSVDKFKKEFLSAKEKQKKAVANVMEDSQKLLRDQVAEMNRVLVLKADHVDISRLEEIVNNTVSIKRRARGKDFSAIDSTLKTGGNVGDTLRLLEKELNEKVSLDDFALLHNEVEKMTSLLKTMNASRLASGKTTMEMPMGFSSQKCASCDRPLPYLDRSVTAAPRTYRRTGALRLQKDSKKGLYQVSGHEDNKMMVDPMEKYVKTIYNLGMNPDQVIEQSYLS